MSKNFVSYKKFENSKDKFIVWIDIMGIQNFFKKTFETPCVFITKLHNTFLNVLEKNSVDSFYYSIIDGLYFTHTNETIMLNVISDFFIEIAKIFLAENNAGYRFIIRAGLAHGKVQHGRDIDEQSHKKSLEKILFGEPLVTSNAAEKHAPPFGVRISTKNKKLLLPLTRRFAATSPTRGEANGKKYYKFLKLMY